MGFFNPSAKNYLLAAERFFEEGKLRDGAAKLIAAESLFYGAGQINFYNKTKEMHKKLIGILAKYKKGREAIATSLFEAFKKEYNTFLKEVPT